jgi:hypothetical protein
LEFLTNFAAKPVKARVVRQVVKISWTKFLTWHSSTFPFLPFQC